MVTICQIKFITFPCHNFALYGVSYHIGTLYNTVPCKQKLMLASKALASASWLPSSKLDKILEQFINAHVNLNS